jgi:hypothetical protein
LKDILVRADISPQSAYNDQCKNDIWRAKTLFFEDFAQFWVLLYGCPALTNDGG